MPDFTPSLNEDDVSQLPALHLLQNLGFIYLSPTAALKLRGERKSNLLLEPILMERLAFFNRIEKGGQTHQWSHANLSEAVRTLKSVPVTAGLMTANAQLTEWLLMGKSLPQNIGGDTKSHTLQYIDWNPATAGQNNLFHVTEEFEVERTNSSDLRRPDLVLFVNGIPFAVIECKCPTEGVKVAISQQLRNQKPDEIPALFGFVQLLGGIATNEAKYSTVGAPAHEWSLWREDDAPELQTLVRKPLSNAVKDEMFKTRTKAARAQFDMTETERLPTEQDRLLYSLFRPERMLELAREFTLFDAGEKKVARYQQFFVVRNIIERIQKRNNASEARRGGVVWHTQGSGKSLTMVMLAKAIARLQLPGTKIVLVNDRIELDGQILTNFSNCGMDVVKAPTGPQLPGLLQSSKSQIITTVINKFVSAAQGDDKGKRAPLRLDSPNIFVMVDESHRSQFSIFHSRMKQALPNACLLGFTGTPIKKKGKAGEMGKDTIEKFGGLIYPVYTIRQAVADGAVVPLLYEGREVPQTVDSPNLDFFFERVTRKLSDDEKADLKRKLSHADEINKVETRIRMIALDIIEHWEDNWSGTGFKAQLVAPDKATAVLYQKFLNQYSQIPNEVIISAPDTREDHVDIDESNISTVQDFWKKMMARFDKSEKKYNDEIVAAFKGSDGPEILIVVSKLITGFDAPRDTVMYLTRTLDGHTLLQAIARVNRRFAGKDYGHIVDYRGVLTNLNQAMTFYDQLANEGYDEDDVADTVTSVAKILEDLPERWSETWALFEGVNRADNEAMERHLAEQSKREEFYDHLTEFAKCLKIARASVTYLNKTDEATQRKYEGDLRFWEKMRQSLGRRYAEKVDYKEYEGQVRKLLGDHVRAEAAKIIVEEFDIFDSDAFAREIAKVEGDPTLSEGAKADQIAHRLQKTAVAKMEEDPAFYSTFSRLVEDAINDFAQNRIDEATYLNRIKSLGESGGARAKALPIAIRDEPVAQAFYGLLRPALEPHLSAQGKTETEVDETAAQWALQTDGIIQKALIVNWQHNEDLQKQLEIDLETAWHEGAKGSGFAWDYDDIDALLERTLEIAKRRYAQ